MRKTGVILGSVAMTLSLFVSYPALSQGSVDFGDDSSRWANDGQCDDPRFEGPGASAVRVAADEGKDATDCRTAFDAGTVTLAGSSSSTSPSATPKNPPAATTQDGDIDFGDDSGAWANDGECDDPRFGGSLESHILADATDCQTAFEAGKVEYIGFTTSDNGEIDFGDDSGSWADDGECDDPRFGGSLESHRFADATDCQAAYELDPSIYIGEESDEAVDAGEIDFGDDSGSWANDGECDDPRFGGSLNTHRLADATDCRAAYEADPTIYVGGQAIDASEIDFGDDSGDWAHDGVCDDPRFGGSLDSHRLADATDCLEAYEAGDVYYTAGENITIDGIDFGDDSGTYANDGECDDARFTGPGMGASLDSHRFADATDCSTAYSAGDVTLADEDSGDTAPSFRINFGDDSGDYPNDGECDDPRFQGRGAAMELYDSNILGDASDCRAAYDAGTVTYVP